MRFHVFGAGCYGTFYGRQLLRASAAGALEVERIVLVDHAARPRASEELPPDPRLVIERAEWDDYLDRLLECAEPAGNAQLVTPPFTPHLAVRWLLRRLAADRPGLAWRTEQFRQLPGTPFQKQEPGGPLLVSHADWICPVNCIEPETCPHTRGRRSWDLDRTVPAFAAALEAIQPVTQVHLFHCHHRAYGVGAYPASGLVTARAAMLRALDETASGAPGTLRFLVGTISHCHGALHLVTVRTGTVPVLSREAPVPDLPHPDHSAGSVQ